MTTPRLKEGGKLTILGSLRKTETMWRERGDNLIQGVGYPRDGDAENTAHCWCGAVRQPGGLKHQDTTGTRPLEVKGRRWCCQSPGAGAAQKKLEVNQVCCSRWRRKGTNTLVLPSSRPPVSRQCLPLAESIWKLVDVRELGDAACRGHCPLQNRGRALEGTWAKSRTGSEMKMK